MVTRLSIGRLCDCLSRPADRERVDKAKENKTDETTRQNTTIVSFQGQTPERQTLIFSIRRQVGRGNYENGKDSAMANSFEFLV